MRSPILLIACWFALVHYVAASCHFERLAEDVNPEFRNTALPTDEVSLYPNEVMRVRLRCTAPPGLQQRISVVHVTKADKGDNYAELWQGLGIFAAPHDAPVFLLRSLESSTLLAFDYHQLANFDLAVLAARFPDQPPVRLDVHTATTVPYPLQQVDVNNLRALRAATLAISIRSAALQKVEEEAPSSSVFPGHYSQTVMKHVIEQHGETYIWQTRPAQELKEQAEAARSSGFLGLFGKKSHRLPQSLERLVSQHRADPYYIYMAEKPIQKWFEPVALYTPLALGDGLDATGPAPIAPQKKQGGVSGPVPPSRAMPDPNAPLNTYSSMATGAGLKTMPGSETDSGFRTPPTLPSRLTGPSHLVPPTRHEPRPEDFDHPKTSMAGKGTRDMP